MTTVQRLESEIETLLRNELEEFRRWFLEFDAATWDEQIENDPRTGKFNRLSDAALAEHRTGRSRLL